MFGTVEDVNLVKEKCRLSLSLILGEFRRPLTREDFLSFHLGANLDDYIFPSVLPTLHANADDTQLYLSCSSNVSTGEARANIAIESCIRDIRQWMCVKKLLLKDDKTEFLLVGSCKQLAKVSVDGVRVGDYNISPSPSLRNLGTWLDSYLSMDVNIIKTCACSSAF